MWGRKRFLSYDAKSKIHTKKTDKLDFIKIKSLIYKEHS